MKRIIISTALLILLSFTCFALAQSEEFISYLVDGKAFRLTDVKFESHGEGGYIHIEGVKTDKVDFGPDARPQFRDIETSITFELSPEGDSPVGTHRARSSDTMPVYVSWYESTKTNKSVNVILYQASLDSGDENVMMFQVTFENFGGPGTLIKGTFSGKLFDEQGKLHQVTDGRLAIKLTEAE
ncbi:MAG: hypothetical protein JXB23_07130 [Candidatus Aminicenantes bacterium]|nr:hypothetical protein [Candidatus Aminicenantes bacterium]